MEHETSANSSIHISDVIEVIQTTDPDFTEDEYNPLFSVSSPSGDDDKHRAYVEITEQPAPKALRFRYECEGRSAGSIPGASSTPDNKTYPAIQVVGYVGRAVVVVSCITKDSPYRPHPHSLVGKDGCKRGVCTLELSDDMTATFSNLGIQCVKKRDIDEALRVREEIRVDPFRTGFSHRNQPSSIDLNAVRLCFQVFLEGSEKGKFTFQLTPVVSDPIYDKKAMSDLVICKMSDCSASVAGGKEIILLCEKVAKEDIQVRFFEPDSAGRALWESQGDFTPAHVHKQVAISLRTPRYRTLDVSQPVDACIQLRRPSDGATSDALPFQLLPLDSGCATLNIFWERSVVMVVSLPLYLEESNQFHSEDVIVVNVDRCKTGSNKLSEAMNFVKNVEVHCRSTKPCGFISTSPIWMKFCSFVTYEWTKLIKNVLNRVNGRNWVGGIIGW